LKLKQTRITWREAEEGLNLIIDFVVTYYLAGANSWQNLGWNCKTKRSWLDTLFSRHEAKYYKIALRVRGSVQSSDSFACIRVGTARGGNSETRVFEALSI